MRHVLVATDGSADGERALDVGVALAKDTRRALVVVNVSTDLSSEDMQALAAVESGITDELDQLSNPVVEMAVRRVKALGLADIRTHVAYGQPTAGIIAAAQKYPVDFIVVGRRGRGQLTGLLLGSVSQSLVSQSPCPLIIVP